MWVNAEELEDTRPRIIPRKHNTVSWRRGGEVSSSLYRSAAIASALIHVGCAKLDRAQTPPLDHKYFHISQKVRGHCQAYMDHNMYNSTRCITNSVIMLRCAAHPLPPPSPIRFWVGCAPGQLFHGGHICLKSSFCSTKVRGYAWFTCSPLRTDRQQLRVLLHLGIRGIYDAKSSRDCGIRHHECPPITLDLPPHVYLPPFRSSDPIPARNFEATPTSRSLPPRSWRG